MKKKLISLCCYYNSMSKILLKMKLLTFFLFASIASVTANGYSQQIKFTMNLENRTVYQVFQEIEKTSEFIFIYSEKSVDLNRKIDIKVDQLFKGTNNDYEIHDRQIVILSSEKSEFPTLTGEQPQKKEISGKITDTKGVSLPGVSVVVKGTTSGTVSDSEGKFRISVPADSKALTFSFVGMKSQEIAITGKTTINTTMLEETFGLDEVVAVGYGTQKRANLTGSVSSVDTKQLGGRVATSSTSLLQGLMPGVFVTESSGQPGATIMNVLIRGLGTMNNSSPMVLIDGIEATMNDINPNDIDNINVLKDAAAASIYGTRAANGVILVTTKRGNLGSIKVNYQVHLGSERVIHRPQILNSWDQATLLNEAYANDGLAPIYSAAEIQKFKSGSDPYNYPNSDWYGKLLKTGTDFTQTHNLSFSGGTEKSRFLLSMEYYDQDGLVARTNYKRYNLRFNLDSKVNNWLTVGLNSSLSNSAISEPTNPIGQDPGVAQLFRQVEMIPTTAPIKDANGNYVPWLNGNPLAILENGGSYGRNNYHAVESVFGELTLLKGLVLKGIMGINYSLDDNKLDINSIAYSNGNTQGPNNVTDYLIRAKTITLQSFLTYTKSVNNHNLKLLLGVDRESYTYNYDNLYRNSLPSNSLNQIDAGASSSMTNSGNSSQARIGSYFGRINYDYKGRYLFEANLRRDGSSKFGPGYQWGSFPSFSAGWRLSEEKFIKDLSWINNLKIRGSWGKLGNHNIGDYLYAAKINLGQNYPFGGAMHSGAAVTTANVPNITWESTTEKDLGFDANLFNNKFSATVDYYDRLTDNILANIPVSAVFGLPAPTINAGSMRNKGFEIQVRHNNNIGALNYNIGGNIGINHNKVEKFPKPSLGNQIERVGVPWNSYYGYQCIGIYQSDADAASLPHVVGSPVKAGDLIFKDQNGDGIIDAKDRVVLGNPIPVVTYGFDLSLSYHHFDLMVIFQGAANVYTSLGNIFWPFTDGGTAYNRHLDRTIVQNGQVIKKGYYPRTLINSPSRLDATNFSSFQVLKADYLRLKSLQLGYTLPSKWTEKVNLAKAAVFLSCKNPLTFTKFMKDYDPEINGSSNTANYTYPQTQIYTLGLNVNF